MLSESDTDSSTPRSQLGGSSASPSPSSQLGGSPAPPIPPVPPIPIMIQAITNPYRAPIDITKSDGLELF